MATALTPSPSPSPNTKHWWPRLSANRESLSCSSVSPLYNEIPTQIGWRPCTAPGGSRIPMISSVANPSPASPDVFNASARSSSRFKLAAVIGFGSKSKKQQPVDIQEPPEHPPPSTSKSHTSKEFFVSPRPPTSPHSSLSHGVASSLSATSIASTELPLTPADDPASPALPISWQHSLMTLTDDDLFATAIPPVERRSSAHSDKSLSRRLMQKIDGKSSKTSARLPMGDGPKRDSKDRSATLPKRTRILSDALETNQPLRAVEPPWATSDQPEMTSSRAASKDISKTMKAVPSSATLRSPQNKPTLPWPQAQAARENGSLHSHQRQNSSSSISKEPLTDTRSTHTAYPSTSSSIQFSPKSQSFSAHLFTSSSRSKSGSTDQHHTITPSSNGISSAKALLTPAHVARTNPRPPPTSGLPPTPTPTPTSDHPLRSRSRTAASASSTSFASSISSLSFTSRPSPQDPPIIGGYDYPSLLNETLPISVGTDDAAPLLGVLSSRSPKNSTAMRPAIRSTPNDQTPKAAKAPLPGSRALPPIPGTSPLIRRERALSATSSSPPDTGRILRKQRSFHNTSQQAPAPTLRHCNSFDPAVVPGSGEEMHSPSLSPLSSPPLPPPQDLPPLPPPLTGITKRLSSGKDSVGSPSPRRKLFGTNKHDRERERERKHELDNVNTTIPTSASSSRLSGTSSCGFPQSSLWFDDRATNSEPASASTSPSTAATHDVAQHIVPPAELLRLGAAWERENETKNGLRRTKSSWSSRDSIISRTSIGSSSLKTTMTHFSANGSSPPRSSSKLPRSASLLSKASSAPNFVRARGSPPDLSFAATSSAMSQDSYTSLSPPPPRRQHRSISRTVAASASASAQGSPCFPPLPRRTPPSASVTFSGSMPPKGALIERKPSFLDMTSTRQSVTIEVPDPAGSDREDYEQDSFLELRGMDTIDTIRESISSLDSFVE